MSAIKNVAIFGASGALGAPALKALSSSGKFNITVISRTESKATFPSDVKVTKADYTSLSSLTSALSGQDAVISAVGSDGIIGQKLFFDAAIAAGVQRFIPSEFGSDLSNPVAAAFPVFGYKVAVRQYIEEKVAAGAKISYTYVVNGGFLDWGLEHSFLLNWKEGKPEIYDGGDVPASLTSLDNSAQAVVGVLNAPEETKNRQVIVSDVVITQNELLAIAKKVDPKRTWEPIAVNTQELAKENAAKVAGGDFSLPVIFDQLKLSVWGGKEYGQPYKNDNAILGITPKTEADIEGYWKSLLL